MKRRTPLFLGSNHLLAGLVAIGLSLVCGSQTQAASVLANGSFSTGDFTSWTTHADLSNTWAVSVPPTGGIASPGSYYATIFENGGASVDSLYQVVNVSNATAGLITATISVNRASDTGFSGQSGGQWNLAVYGLNAGYTLSTSVSGAVPVGTPTSGGTLLSTAIYQNTAINTWTSLPTGGSLSSTPSTGYSSYEVLVYSVQQGTSTTRNGHFTNLSLDVPIAVPEPSSLGLLAFGGLFMLGRRRRA